MMELPRLRSGTILLGWFSVIVYIISVVFALIGFANIDYIMSKLRRPKYIDPWEWRVRIEAVFGIILVVGLVDLLASFIMIVGAAKNNRYLLIPWLVTVAITMTTMQTFLYIVPEYFYYRELAPLGTYLGIFINLLFQLYLWLCVFSLYREIKLHQTEEHQRLMAERHINYQAI